MKFIKIAAISLSICLMLSVIYFYQYGTREKVVFIVKNTERVVTGNGDSLSSKYLVFTDKETFQNTDTIFYMKFNSSDIYGAIEKESKYESVVYGWRIPFLSMYRNIVSLTLINP